ncbi:MAG: SRPBCC family protein [Ignavibacteria bacterium]|nr:SRPBCC family protein [Ignavibacteria bacterium]
MSNKLQSELQIEINAPIEVVGKYADDLSLITSFHPLVKQVEYLSGTQFRDKGVKYKCIVPDGPRKGSCVEEVVEYEKNKRMVVKTPEDTWGLHKLLHDFTSEITLTEKGKDKTILELKNYYDPIGLKGKLSNFFIKRKMKKQFIDTFAALKKLIESENNK